MTTSTGLRNLQIAPSILAADFANLASAIRSVEHAADLLHVDVMDGHFVPNLTIGPPVVTALAAHTALFLDCHLMVTDPGVLLEDFAEAGAGGISIHIELGDPRSLFARIRALGMQVGLAISPQTPIESAWQYLDEIDLLLVMSVNPGWGGQEFIPEALEKLSAARSEIDNRNLKVLLEVDGGINLKTVAAAAVAGADILVAGSAVFRALDPAIAIGELRALADPQVK